MNNREFRRQFAAFLDDESCYKKFVSTINRGRTNRLLYWQESCLEKFCSANQIEPPCFNEISEIFRVCEIHGETLRKGTQGIFDGEIDYCPTFTKAAELLFPYTNSRLLNGKIEQYGQKVESWYCDVCVEAEKKWLASDAKN